MKLTQNFDLAEVERSMTAQRFDIQNRIPEKYLPNLVAQYQNIWQPAREAKGVIFILSGYRSPELNLKIGGARYSQHMNGEASDARARYCSTLELAQFIAKNCEFDQLILEGYDPNNDQAGWVHASFKRNGGNRRQQMTATFSKRGVLYAHVNLLELKNGYV